jgi:hypothetical protein
MLPIWKNHCKGIAKFIWRELDNKWEIFRALSYGHREIVKAKKDLDL